MVGRGCKRCLGVPEQMSSESVSHRCNPRVQWCKMGWHRCKTLSKDICSETPKHICTLSEPLFGLFLTCFPGKQHLKSRPTLIHRCVWPPHILRRFLCNDARTNFRSVTLQTGSQTLSEDNSKQKKALQLRKGQGIHPRKGANNYSCRAYLLINDLNADPLKCLKSRTLLVSKDT